MLIADDRYCQSNPWVNFTDSLRREPIVRRAKNAKYVCTGQQKWPIIQMDGSGTVFEMKLFDRFYLALKANLREKKNDILRTIFFGGGTFIILQCVLSENKLYLLKSLESAL